MFTRLILTGTLCSIAVLAQDPPAAAPDSKAAPKSYLVEPGTHIPLSLINSVSTKNSVPGDRVYLETVFPILVDGRIVIPPGSYVMGTITEVQRPGKVKGRGEFHLRFDSLTLANGTTRDFRARVSGLDGRASEELDRKEGSIKSEGNKSGDTRTVGETAAAGASVGALAGSVERSSRDGRRHRRGCRCGCGSHWCSVHARSGGRVGQGDYARNGARPAGEIRR